MMPSPSSRKLEAMTLTRISLQDINQKLQLYGIYQGNLIQLIVYQHILC